MSILFIIIALAILIFIHEFGHFIVAKLLRMKVEEFGLGFPPRLFSVKKGETVYSLNLFPIGGFVKILGTEGQSQEDRASFASRGVGQRTLVVLAGILMNILLAYVIFIFLFVWGFPQGVDNLNRSFADNIRVGFIMVQKNPPADLAGLKEGDLILDIKKGESIFPIADHQEFKNLTSNFLGEEI